MRRESFMIGDWVYVPHDGHATHYGQVKAIYESCISVKLGDDSWAGGAEALKPIPLTQKILEKNGFVESDKDADGAIQFEYGNNYLGVSVWVKTKPCLLGAWRTWTDETQSYSMIEELPINYVHELQHCLKLVGIEKEIVL